MKIVLRIFSYVKRYPGMAVAQLACAVLGTVMLVIFPKIIEVIIDDVIPHGKKELLLPMIGIALASFLFRELFEALRIHISNSFEQKVVFDLRSDLYAHLQKLPLPWFDNHPTGDIMTCVSDDVESMERVLIDGIEQGLIALLQVLIVGGMLFFISPALAAAAMAPIPLLLAGAYLYSRSRERHRALRKATGEMSSLLHDNIAGIRQIKAYALEESEHGRFNSFSERVRTATLRVMTAWATYKAAMAFSGSLGRVIVLGVGATLVFRQQMDLGQLTAFLYLVTLHFYEPFTRLHQLNQLFQSGYAAAERVFGILDAEPERHLEAGKPLHRPEGHVAYAGVSFAYPTRQGTLRDISLEALPGQQIALVGATGAGKSTIINLLARFYEFEEGSITIDGIDIRRLNKRSLRANLGYVTQESFLFNGSVRDNLLIAKREATEEELWNALASANAHDFVERLPERLDTHVGERGVKLSVGEKQRISIARALLKNPPILLLDEATASVDTETERLIQQALEKLMANRTSFVIAHRLSTVRRADRIYVLDHGRIAEQGTHEELLRQDGIYAKLCRTSFLEEAETGT